MASKILVDELAPYSHATDVTLATGKNITGTNAQFKITGGSSTNMLTTDGSGSLSWSAQPSAGLAGADMWRLNADSAIGTGIHIIYGNWEQPEAADMPGTIGSSMAVDSASSGATSGAWTFPATGIWSARWTFDQRGNTDTHALYSKIWVTDNNGASWNEAVFSDATSIHNYDVRQTLEIIFDCEDTANDKIRLSLESDRNTTTLQGDTDRSTCYAVFMKLGDT